MNFLEQLLDDTNRCLARYETHFGTGPLLAAVSGGRDSTALAWLLARLRTTDKLAAEVVIGHVDHGVHADSHAGAAHVRTLCADLGLRFVTERLDGIPETEEALREARYAALTRMARAAGAKILLTAHHADDDVETVLFRMLRGTGPRGLAGIPEFRRLDDDVVLVRPLLRARSATLHRLIERLGLAFLEDPTNVDLRYARNRLRHDLLPTLRETLGTGLDASLLALARTARSITGILDAQARRLLAEDAGFVTPWRCEFTVGPLDDDSRCFVEEALCQVHERLHPSGRRPGWHWVQRVLDLCSGDQGQRVAGAKALLVERTRTGLLLVDEGAAGAPPGGPVELPENGLARFGATEWVVTSSRLPHVPLSPSPRETGPRRALLDPTGAPRPWRLRKRRPGDRFWPLGAAGEVDLRRFLCNRHVPRFDRIRLPLLVDAEDRILWVPGTEISEPDRIQLDTTACCELGLSIVGGASGRSGSY